MLAVVSGAAPRVHAGCNLIPQAQPAFRGALGTLDRPYAAPGDFVDVNVRQALCDGASSGVSFDPAHHEVTLVFNPEGGPRRVVVLTTSPCASLAARLDACEETSGVVKNGVSCVQVNQPGDPTGMGLAFVDGAYRLRFRFPDTDGLLAPSGDRRGLTGPVTIAVSSTGAALPCGLATNPCRAQARQLGLIACVDELYAADGTCQPNLAAPFSHFTALPVPNDFEADCYTTSPPCTATATEVRFALDRDGNLLFPVHWEGVLPSQDDGPVPRSLRVTVRPPVPIAVPDRRFLSSFTPEGQPLPPIFEPQADPTLGTPGVLNLFGTTDAPTTVLRIANRRGRCNGGGNAGEACYADVHCPGGACVDACVGGANDGLACTTKKDCPAGACGSLFDADTLAAFATSGGPLVVPRLPAGMLGVCQAPPFAGCGTNADCGGAPCVTYAFQAQDPIALESVSNGSTDVLTLTAPETLTIVDRTGDGDVGDVALTLRNRTTGEAQPLGKPAGTNVYGLLDCGLTGTPESRAIVQVPVTPFTTTALATEGDVVAFVESENGQGFCDENGDTDSGDGILRVVTVPGNERTAGLIPPRAVDTALRINEQSLAVSAGKVFVRSSEASMAKKTLERVSNASGIPGDEANGYTQDAQLSKDRRWVAFTSGADNLLGPGGDTNFSLDVFVRDRQTGTVTRMSVSDTGAEVLAPDTTGIVGLAASISGDGRYVVFQGVTNNIVPGDTNICFGGPCSDIFLHDRDTDDDDVYDEPGAIGTTRISLGPGGVQADGESNRPIISADGKLVVFESYATNLVVGDANGEPDIFVRDLDAGVTERVSVANDGSENIGIQAEPRVYDISDDGRYVVFDMRTTNLPDGPEFSHGGPNIDVFVRDRLTGTTDQMTDYQAPGENYSIVITSEFAQQPRISGDGRWVVFTNQPDFGGQVDVLIRDRTLEVEPELVNVPVGAPVGPPYLCQLPDVSDDGRFVTFWSEGEFLIEGFDGNGSYDLFIRDRTVGSLERVSVRADGHEGSGELGPNHHWIAHDGREVLFVSSMINLLGPAVDGNGAPDAFIRGIDAADPNGVDALFFSDGALDDTVLEVFDPVGGAMTTLCPAADVAVVHGAAAFLRPESATGTAACPGGPLNADGDVSDAVVQYWPGSGPVQNLGRAGTAVALTATHVATITPEAGEGAGSLNGDPDTSDGVVAVRPVGAGAWTSIGEAADRLLACGSVFAFLTPEAAQNATSLNGDADALDRVVRIYVPATATLIDTGQAATELVCNDQIVAFRTSEVEQGHANLLAGSGTVPGFSATFVMQGYDLGRPECLTPGHPADCVVNSHRSARVCDLAACDPRIPYKLIGSSVKFIAFECDQRGDFPDVFCEPSGSDIDGNLRATDLVLQIFDVHAGTVNVVGGLAGGDPLQGGTTGGDEGAIVVSPGRCIETFTAPCTTNDQCGSGGFCAESVCTREHRTCRIDLDCPPGIPCEDDDVAPAVGASPDTDGDGIVDHVDDCVFAANPTQADADGDGAGDACDLATCGDGVRSYDEVCEAGDDALCPGTCSACRCATCTNLVADPKGKAQIKTKQDAGQLGVGTLLTLGASYTNQPVTIALADGDSAVIAREAVGALPPSGKPPFKKWVYKTKRKSGVVQVQLQARPKEPGVYKLSLKAKRWFPAAAANQPAASTELTITIGTQCFRIPVTKKSD